MITKTLSILLAIAEHVLAAAAWEDMNKMEFAYAIHRHGARSAIIRSDDINLLDLEPHLISGELTPQGTR